LLEKKNSKKRKKGCDPKNSEKQPKPKQSAGLHSPLAKGMLGGEGTSCREKLETKHTPVKEKGDPLSKERPGEGPRKN